MTGRTAWPIKTKLGIGTHVDPGSVLVKVKVMWCHLVNANKTPDTGPQGRDNRSNRGPNSKGLYRGPQARGNRWSVKRDKYGGQRSARAERIKVRRAETTPSGGRVIFIFNHQDGRHRYNIMEKKQNKLNYNKT